MLGVMIFLVVVAAMEPAGRTAAASAEPAMARVRLSEEYLSRLLGASLGSPGGTAYAVDVQPAERLVVAVETQLSPGGQRLRLPASLDFTIYADGGRPMLTTSDAGSGEMGALSASPVLIWMNANLQRELNRAVGQGWRLEGIASDDESLTLTLVEAR